MTLSIVLTAVYNDVMDYQVKILGTTQGINGGYSLRYLVAQSLLIFLT